MKSVWCVAGVAHWGAGPLTVALLRKPPLQPHWQRATSRPAQTSSPIPDTLCPEGHSVLPEEEQCGAAAADCRESRPTLLIVPMFC